eukprot:SAG31_NODE_37906_length_300_cov_1.019900_1_plen_51_part_10
MVQRVRSAPRANRTAGTGNAARLQQGNPIILFSCVQRWTQENNITSAGHRK